MTAEQVIRARKLANTSGQAFLRGAEAMAAFKAGDYQRAEDLGRRYGLTNLELMELLKPDGGATG